jgi:phospholipid/cholesterol/gamma-HCH transport system substrate-binding protein
MSPAADIDPRFRRLGLKLGLFVGAGVLLCVGLLLAVAAQQGFFSPKSPVYFQADTGTDLRPGMAVKLSGFKIGEVRRVEFNELARVDVEMQIEDRYLKWIKADSVAMLAREGMIGDSFISITSGNPAMPALTKEDRLRFVMGSSLGDIALDVRNRVVPVIDELHTFLRYTNDPKGDVRASFSELRQLAVQLQSTRKEVDATLREINTLAGQDMPATLEQARTALARADSSLLALEKAIPALTAQAGRSLESLNEASAAATKAALRTEKMMDESAPRLDRTLAEAEVLLRESRAAVGAARGRWPFKGPDVPPAVPDAPVQAVK